MLRSGVTGSFGTSICSFLWSFSWTYFTLSLSPIADQRMPSLTVLHPSSNLWLLTCLVLRKCVRIVSKLKVNKLSLKRDSNTWALMFKPKVKNCIVGGWCSLQGACVGIHLGLKNVFITPKFVNYLITFKEFGNFFNIKFRFLPPIKTFSELAALAPWPYMLLTAGCERELLTEGGSCSISTLFPTLCNPMDCSTPGFPVLHYLLAFAQIHIHCVSDYAIQPSHPLLSPSPPTFSLAQHQCLFQ